MLNLPLTPKQLLELSSVRSQFLASHNNIRVSKMAAGAGEDCFLQDCSGEYTKRLFRIVFLKDIRIKKKHILFLGSLHLALTAVVLFTFFRVLLPSFCGFFFDATITRWLTIAQFNVYCNVVFWLGRERFCLFKLIFKKG